MNRRQAGNRKLAGIGSGKSGVDIALGIEAGAHCDQIWRNVQYICYDLSCRCLMSLALWTGTNRDHNFAVDIQFAVGALRIAGERRSGIYDLRLSKIISARIESRTNANANQPALLLSFSLLFLPRVPANELLGKLEHSGIVSRVVNAAIRRGVGKFFGADVIAHAHFVGGDAEFVRTNIYHPLQEPQVLHP